MASVRRILIFFLLSLLLQSMPGTVNASSLLLHQGGKESKIDEQSGLGRIWDYRPPLVTTVYAKDGSVLGYLYREMRFLEPLSKMSPFVLKAFLAAEDSSFYEHEGIDLTAIFRAMTKNITAGDIVQGGSTITQQVVKRLLLTSEKSFARKIKEAILAYRLEQQMGKDEILAIYLNEIFLGAGAYGVEAAARTYFGKHADELDLAESAVLAGLPKAPSRYNPFRFPDEAKNRQRYVLGRMLELNWITQQEYDQAIDEPLEYKTMPDPSWTIGAYYLEEVRRWLIENLPKMNLPGRNGNDAPSGEDLLYESGLQVYTTIDLEHQAAAEQALRKGLEDSSKRRGWRGPVRTLQASQITPFLLAQDEQYKDIKNGQWVKALVSEVDKKGAKVLVGKRAGYIDVKTMSWCRTPNPEVSSQGARKITNATDVLHPGDVVWASLIAPPRQGTPLELSLEQRPKVEGALVSLDPVNGDVMALVGGYDFKRSQFNRATQAIRQPGSAFKPIVYSTAMDMGFSPASVVNDEAVSYYDPSTNKTWSPKNYSGDYAGPMLLATALAKSKNLVTVRVADMIGIENVIKRAHTLGLVGDFQPFLPICLGAIGVTPLNLCQAYTAFARDGSYIIPRLVLSIKDNSGKEIYKSTPKSVEAISPQNAFIMASMLKEVVRRGTGAKARKLNRPVAGKTGTTNDEQDAWFIGFTPYLLTGVYVGFDQVAPMGRKETGSTAALPIWLDYRLAVEQNYPAQDFKVPPNIVFRHVASWNTNADYYLPFDVNAQQRFYEEDFLYSDGGMTYESDKAYQQSYKQYDYNRDAVPDQEEYLLKQLF